MIRTSILLIVSRDTTTKMARRELLFEVSVFSRTEFNHRRQFLLLPPSPEINKMDTGCVQQYWYPPHGVVFLAFQLPGLLISTPP